MKVVPWRCHICDHEFETPGGGLCAECDKVACRGCLRVVVKRAQGDPKRRLVLVCKACAARDRGKRSPGIVGMP